MAQKMPQLQITVQYVQKNRQAYLRRRLWCLIAGLLLRCWLEANQRGGIR